MADKLSIEEIHDVQLGIMRFFDSLCTSQNFTYVIAYGTLLGAVRHKGFIPWDDDVDIWMPRKDYNRFCKYCYDNLDQIAPFKLINLENEARVPYLISRFSNMDYPLVYDSGNNYESGVFIDIFPLDNMGRSLAEAKSFYKKVYFLKVLHDYSRMNRFPRNTTLLKQLASNVLYPLARLVGEKRLRKDLISLSQKKMNEKENNYYGIPMWPSYYLAYEIFDRKFINQRVQLEFENELFWAPKDYEEMLRTLYNNYLKYPPKSEQTIKRHGYDAYKR